MKIDPVQISLGETVSRNIHAASPVHGEKSGVPSRHEELSLPEGAASKRIPLQPFLKARETSDSIKREDLEKLVLKPSKVTPEERMRQMLSEDDIKNLVYLGTPFGRPEKGKGPHMILDPGMLLDRKG